MRLHWYIARRLLSILPVLFVMLLIMFTVSRLIPGDPVFEYLGVGTEEGMVDPEIIARVRAELGLDKPLYIQFLVYLNRIIHGDFGFSYSSHRPVIADIAERFMSTAELAVVSFLIIISVGVPLGIGCALKKEGVIDNIGRFIAIIGGGTPSYVVGIILQLTLSYHLGLFPLAGRFSMSMYIRNPIQRLTGLYLLDSLLTWRLDALVDCLSHLVLPAITLSTRGLAYVVRMTRTATLSVLGEEYIRTARAMGLDEHVVIWKYALRNALVMILTVTGIVFGGLLRGAFLVEAVFDWPGLGGYMVKAISWVDYPGILGTSLVICSIYLLVNLVVDVSYKIVDPRIEY